MGHLAETISSGDLALHTSAIAFPHGYNLLSFGHAGVQALGIPLILAGLSVGASYNTIMLLAFTATGVCGHLFFHKLTQSHTAATLGAAVFLYNPIFYGEMSAGCLELVAAWFIPLNGYMILRICDSPTLKRSLQAAGVLAVTGIFNWYFTIFSGILALAFVCWQLAKRSTKGVVTSKFILISLAVAALANLPLLPHVQRETPSRPPISRADFTPEQWVLSGEIANANLPLNELTPEALLAHDNMQVVLNSTNIEALSSGHFSINPLESTPGRIAWIAGLAGLFLARRRGLPWALMTAGFTTLTLGPYLLLDASPNVSEWSLRNPLPYEWLYNHLPMFSKAYRPYRIGFLTLLSLGSLGAIGFSALRWRHKRWAVGGLFLLTATQPHWIDGAPSSRPMASTAVPEVYSMLSELPEGALLELPLLYQPTSSTVARGQYYQLTHGHPIVNSNQLIRRTELPQFVEFIQSQPLLSYFATGTSDLDWQLSADDFEQLAAVGILYISCREGGTHQSLLAEHLGAPIITDDQINVFAVR
jgi:hypothetical protein